MSPDKDPGHVVATSILDFVANQTPSAKKMQADQQLEEARILTVEYESVLDPVDRKIIEERMTIAREIESGLQSKWGVAKYLHSRRYLRAAKNAYRFAETRTDRVSGRGGTTFEDRPNIPTAPGSEATGMLECVIRIARSLYRCHLSCKDAFPSPEKKAEWIASVWRDACMKAETNLSPSFQDKIMADSSMTFLTDMKMNIGHAVAASYGFRTNQNPDSITQNAKLAQTLLTDNTFTYHEPNTGGTPLHPYRHPIVQKVINIMWFQNKDADGIIFHEHFSPIPVPAIALALTLIECCIDEWRDGIRRVSSWDEEHYKPVYYSHIKSLTDFRQQVHAQGIDLLEPIQSDLLKQACKRVDSIPGPVHLPEPFSPAPRGAFKRDGRPTSPHSPPLGRMTRSKGYF